MLEAAETIGFDPIYGRRIGAVLREHDLEEVFVEGVVFEWDSTHPLAALYQMTLHRLRELVIDSGALPEADLARLQEIMQQPGFHGISNTLFLARGRKRDSND